MKKKDIQMLLDKFDNEGTDYALFNYSDWEDINDPKFHIRLKVAKAAREDLYDYLRSEAERNKIEIDEKMI